SRTIKRKRRAVRVSNKFTSKIFNITERRQSLSSFVGREAKDFKNLTKRRQIESQPAGRLYRRRGGPGFTRSHRASARGQRPAIDTGRLLNSIQDKRLSETSVQVAAGGEYAKYLQSERLDRRIMDEADRAEAQAKANRNAIALVDTWTA